MPPIAQIRGLLFDKDGTLLDFNRTWFDVVMRLAQTVAPGDTQARQLVEAGGYDWSTGRFRSGSVVAAGTVSKDVVGRVSAWPFRVHVVDEAEIHALDEEFVPQAFQDVAGRGDDRPAVEVIVEDRAGGIDPDDL